MRQLKDRIPKTWRLAFQLLRRRVKDEREGIQALLAMPGKDATELPYSIEEKQPIRPSSYFENKVHNLRLGCQKINEVVIHPGQIFSYWHTIGAPTPENGFREGRNLINGQLQADYGGGLCQLSGIIYYLALRAGLDIVERHHHSIDIYTEEERFCPLGSDATVVYGYKDLRIRNNLFFPVKYCISIKKQEVEAKLYGQHEVPDYRLKFKREKVKNALRIITLRHPSTDHTDIEKIAHSVYFKKS